MKKKIIILSFLLLSTTTFSQKEIKATDEIKIFGVIENTLTIPFSRFLNEKTSNIGNFTITNHLGEFKKEYKNLKGVALLPFLEQIKIKTPSPKELSEFYLIFRGSDGYSVVFSWNEIFNNETGKNLFIVTETDNKKLSESTDRVLLISTKDFKTGRRHIKGLNTIEIKRI